MHPAPSVILFSVLSGAGFGLLAFLAAGAALPAGWVAVLWWGLGYGLAVLGLLASTFHLGHPERALKAFSQWRSSWLSREAWAAVASLGLLAPMALSDWLGLGLPRGFGLVGAAAALVTVFTTAMIYTQLRTVPRWHQPLTPVMFLAFALTGGAILSGHATAPAACALLLAVLLAHWHLGDGRFARAGQSLGSATGLGAIGPVTVFEQAHTGGNYLMREMIFVVGRKHALRLRAIALILACLVPAVALAVLPAAIGLPLAGMSHLLGAAAARWLFFAEARHVVGLYYGQE